ncbi:MAG: dockerin type I domain-containing protein [Anaerolineae bacterium]
MPACRATCPDLDGDRQVGIADSQAVAGRWRLTAANPDPDGDPNTPNYGAAFDRDGDGEITVADIMEVAAQWDQGCP